MSHHITTKRLTLRPLGPEDAAPITAMIGDYDVVRWLTRAPYPYTHQDAVSFIDSNAEGQHTLAILADETFVGVVSNKEELGYWIGKPYWGRGFVTEAARAVIARYFTEGHEDLESGHLLHNAASRAVLCKLGFVDTVIQKRPSASLGKSVDVQRMTLSRAAWEQSL